MRLFFLILIITLPGVLILHGQFWDNKNAAIVDSEERSATVIKQLISLQQLQITQSGHFLQELAKMSPLQSGDHQLCSDFLATMLKLIPAFSNLTMRNLDGELLCNAKPSDQQIDQKDGIYFQQTLLQKRVTLSGIQDQPISKNLSLNFAYPVYKTGSLDVIGAIVADISLQWWKEALESLSLPEDAQVYISDANDNIIASHPDNPDHLGKKRPPIVMIDSASQRNAWFDFSFQPSSVEHSISFAGGENHALNISVEYPISEAWQHSNQTLYNRTLLFIAFNLLVLLLVLNHLKITVLAPLQQLTKATNNLLKGKLSNNIKNTNIRELKILQQRFQRMARIRLQSENNAIKHNDELQSLLNSLPDTYLKVSYTGNILSYKKLDAFMPLPQHQDINIKTVLPDDIANQLIQAMHSQDSTQNLIWEFCVTRKEQQYNYEMRCTALSNEMSFIAILRDITQRKSNEEATQLAASVYRNSSEGMAITDADGIILDINPAFSRLTQYTQEEILGQSFSKLSSGKHSKSFYKEMWEQITTTGRWQGEIENRRKNGELFIELLTIDTIYNEDQRVHRYVAIFTDITASKAAEKLIWKQANFDHLTNLPNRVMLKNTIEKEMARSQRRGSMMAMLLLDLDRFKDVNDTLGHAIGDQLLIEVARRLTFTVRKVDTVARLGGDEFVVLLSDIKDLSDINIIATNILQSLAQVYHFGENTVHISACIGISLYPNDNDCIEDLLKSADQAMYTGKARGRNRFYFFTPEMQHAITLRAELIRSLRKAIEREQFTLYYQPIVDLQTGRINKAEALIRWLHPERGTINPVDFIPLAEETRLINPLGKWIFATALEQVKLIRQTINNAFQITINISPIQFSCKESGIESWSEQLLQADVCGSALVTEITEGLIMDPGKRTQNLLSALKKIGMQLALDDFGTGYSSLSYLHELDSDYLKIDQKFVKTIKPGNDALTMCEAIIVMAHRLGLKVIAEGIETESQKALLMTAGCDFGQGYLFSHPLSGEQLVALLASPSP
ncbi:EAL domain-containing protein [Psychromonas sp.]|uniref:EAL domain-containing protein n=1 Tax=Psychromonas sp. TaxID=1884585 RepID=UPI0035695420